MLRNALKVLIPAIALLLVGCRIAPYSHGNLMNHAPERDPNKPYRDKPVAVHHYSLDALRFLVLGLSYEAMPNVRWL